MLVALVLSTGMALFASAPAWADPAVPANYNGAYSTGNTQTADATGNPVACSDVNAAVGGALISKIVPCMQFTIEQSTMKFAAAMVAWLTPVLYSFLALVFVLFGVRVLMNEPEIYKQGLILLLKIALVATVLSDLGNIAPYDGQGQPGAGKLIPAIYGSMDEMQTVVTGAISNTSLNCDVATYSGPNTPAVWGLMDCVTGKLFGYSTGTDPNTGKKTANMVLISSFFGLMTGFLFGGAWGVVVFLGMLGVLWSVFMMVVRTVVGFLTSYLTICLMVILCPIFLPLSFLRITNNYFDNSWRIMLTAFLTPMLISAYAMFSLIVYDQMLFAPGSLLQNLLVQSNIQDAVQSPRQLGTHPITGNPTALRFDQDNPLTIASALETFGSPMTQFPSMGTANGGNDPGSQLTAPSVWKQNISGLTQTQKDNFEKIAFNELLELFILAWLVNAGMAAWPNMIAQMLGKTSAIKAYNNVLPNNVGMKYRAQNAYKAAQNAFQYKDKSGNLITKSGSQVFGAMPDAARDSFKALFETPKDNS